MAQTHVLRMGGGPVTVSADTGPDAPGDRQVVHHYRIGTADPVMDPATVGDGDNTAFVVGSLALVTFDSNGDLVVSPIAPGAFKIALDRTHDQNLSDDATPINFEILSANAPMLTNIGGAANAYNAGVQEDVVNLELTPRDNPSEEYPLTSWFTDPNEVFITYTAEADTVGRGEADGSDGEAIVSATISDNNLTVCAYEQGADGRCNRRAGVCA